MQSCRLEVPFTADGRRAPCAALRGALQVGRSAEAPGRAPTRALRQLAGTDLWRSGAATVAPKLEAWLSARWHHRLIRFRNL